MVTGSGGMLVMIALASRAEIVGLCGLVAISVVIYVVMRQAALASA